MTATANADTTVFNGGHAKYLFLLNSFPDNSLFNDFVNTPATDHTGNLRAKFKFKTDSLQLISDYQLTLQQGDSIRLANNLPTQILNTNSAISDELRLFDLSHNISEDNNRIINHRLDRLYLDISNSSSVARLGRQALSWGNGLIYNPMDFFNPFDPAAIDKEYKTGDDMLYGQHLIQGSNDLQMVWVLRRDSMGHVSNNVDSIAGKFHGFSDDKEFDLLIASHYNDTIIAAGGIVNLGGAVWRGDITVTHTDTRNITSLVNSLSYSWFAWGHNFSGVLEYFYNGFGQSNKDYSPAALSSNPELVERYLRGELFTLGRHYVAASSLIEITPLWTLTPNIFINLKDTSFLVQLVSTYDLKQDWTLLASLSLPNGASGTEFGGIETGIAGKPLSTELSLFAQLAWYF